MSSVLETFYFMFASNADDVDKGNKKAKKSSDDLEKSQKNNEQQSKKAGEAYLSMTRAAVGMLAAVGAAGVTVALVKGAFQYTEGLRSTSAALGDNIQMVDTWSRVISSAGGDAQSFQNDLRGLSAGIREAAFTGEGSLSPVLRRLGINLRDMSGQIKTPLQLLPEVARAFERLKIDDAQALHLGKMLGLDDKTILLLKQGKANLDQLLAAQKQYQVLTEKDAEATKKLQAQMGAANASWLVLRQRLLQAAIPALTWFFEKLEAIGKWISQNQTLVEGFFIGTALAVTAFFLPAMIKAAAATLAATWPILAIVAAIGLVVAAFAFVYDEIKNFSEGNNSLIGEAVKKWPLLGKAIESVGNYIKWLVDLYKGVGQFLWDLLTNPVKAFDTLARKFKSLVGIFSSDDLDANATLETETKASIAMAQDSIALAAASPIAAMTTNSIMSNRVGGDNTVNVGQVTVVTQATDAAGVSAAVGTSLRDQLRQAVFNADDGVRI